MILSLLLPAVFAHQTQVVRVENLPLTYMSQGWATPQKDKSVDGPELTVAGKNYLFGIGTHAVSRFEIALGGKALSFTAQCGVDDEVGPGRGHVKFQVYVDGKLQYQSQTMTYGTPAETVNVNLKGAKTMTLMVVNTETSIDYDHADWLNPEITVVDGGASAIQPVAPPVEKPPVIAHGFGPVPMINGPRVLGCTAGHDFIWRIPASGKAPLTFSAENLPTGLTLDPQTGIIRGSVQDKGKFNVPITVKGPDGVAHRTVTFDSDGTLALTPPMGWNSWNVWAGNIDEPKMKAAADEFIKSGLAQYGYQYVNIDDTWEGDRTSNGEITGNKKFPDMKGLVDYVHNLGLRIGLYSSPGPTTCAGYPASYQHEVQDANTYAKWGFDYLKYDWCSYGEIAPHPDLAQLEAPYTLMHNALQNSGRDIVFSLCQYGMGDVWNWGASVGGNLWRTTGDINDSWPSVVANGFGGGAWVKGAGPGHWNDPDMLVVGVVGWGNPHPNNLTPNEQLTHITLWSMLAAPMIIGCDLTKLDKFTLDLLTNHDVIDVDQDPLGQAAVPIRKEQTTQVWARPLFDGSHAVALFNLGETAQKVTFHFGDLNLIGKHTIRNLWLMKNIGTFQNQYSVLVPRHGAVFLKVN